MQVTFWGAARTVTGSQHLVEVGGKQVLLDCGLFQGRREEANRINRTLPFPADKLDAVVLSHAHIDHSGNLPHLVKNGFGGDIYCTSASADLCEAMLRDSGRIQEEDAKFLNRRGAQPPVEPIYTEADAIAAVDRMLPRDYARTFEPVPGMRVTFSDAGHMLGSSHELIELEERGKRVRLCFSGDLGRFGMPILRDPAPMPEADYLIIEGTYGDRLHEPISDAKPSLQRALQDAVRRGGKVVIPAFAVGRTQEIVYFLHEIINEGALPNVPVYVDSPLAADVTKVFRMHPECFDPETNELLASRGGRDAFGFSRLRYVLTADESKSLRTLDGPAIFISASGMCENGRVLHHLRNTIEDPRNMVLMVSFQAPHTLGRRLLDRENTVRILGEEFRLRAEVRQLESFSGHADRNDLLAWVKPNAARLRKVFIVHAEEGPAFKLAEGLREIGVPDVVVPRRGDVAQLAP